VRYLVRTTDLLDFLQLQNTKSELLDRDGRFTVPPSPDFTKPSVVVRDFRPMEIVEIQHVWCGQDSMGCAYPTQEHEAPLPESVHHVPGPHVLASGALANGKHWTKDCAYLAKNVYHTLELLWF